MRWEGKKVERVRFSDEHGSPVQKEGKEVERAARPFIRWEGRKGRKEGKNGRKGRMDGQENTGRVTKQENRTRERKGRKEGKAETNK